MWNSLAASRPTKPAGPVKPTPSVHSVRELIRPFLEGIMILVRCFTTSAHSSHMFAQSFVKISRIYTYITCVFFFSLVHHRISLKDGTVKASGQGKKKKKKKPTITASINESRVAKREVSFVWRGVVVLLLSPVSVSFSDLITCVGNVNR